jgi:hypothetical protein
MPMVASRSRVVTRQAVPARAAGGGGAGSGSAPR